MNSGCFIRAYHCLETQRKRKTHFTGNRESMSRLSPTKKVVVVSIEKGLRIAILNSFELF